MGRIQQFTSLVLCFITFQIVLSLPIEVLVLEPLSPVSLNKSLDARPFYIPASKSVSKRALTYAEAVDRGNRLFCRLSNPALMQDQSTVSTPLIVETSGWVRFDQGVDTSTLNVLQPAFNELGITINPLDCHTVSWRHLGASLNSQNQDVPATKARLASIYNAKAGFIIAVFNFGPAWMLRNAPPAQQIYPDVRSWSDITFVEWQTQAQNYQQDIKGLKYVFRYEIANDDTTSIIHQAVGKDNLPWPGVTVPMTDANGQPDERGRAILGTPNGLGIAWLLATHKAQLGQKTIESVQVWTITDPYGEYLMALFTIGPVVPP